PGRRRDHNQHSGRRRRESPGRAGAGEADGGTAREGARTGGVAGGARGAQGRPGGSQAAGADAARPSSTLNNLAAGGARAVSGRVIPPRRIDATTDKARPHRVDRYWGRGPGTRLVPTVEG